MHYPGDGTSHPAMVQAEGSAWTMAGGPDRCRSLLAAVLTAILT